MKDVLNRWQRLLYPLLNIKLDLRLYFVESPVIAVIGLGYVGLPLAVAFGKKFQVIGFDIDSARIQSLKEGQDATLEVSSEEINAAENLSFSSDPNDLKVCNVYIVTVPTPIDDYRRPLLKPLISASEVIGRALDHGDIVVYESTVYPGATEEVCVPVLERESGKVFNQDFFVGYSPERINPGDKQHRLENILKITSGSTPDTAETVNNLYASIITAGTHKTSCIKVAEAAKVIENTQRDLNIALINELALIFNQLGIDTEEVLEAAGTKWNFLNFRPGLVGGHCIGVDPYYLTHKAQEIGYHPEVILAGRRINDTMGEYVASQVIKMMIKRQIHVKNANILMLGLAFKENCPDVRNTKVVDVIKELEDYGARVDVYDPWVDSRDAEKAYGIQLMDTLGSANGYDAIVLAVAHDDFNELGVDKIRAMGKEKHILYDIKYLFPADSVDGRL